MLSTHSGRLSAAVLRTGHRNRLKPPFKFWDEAPRFSQIGCLQEEAKIAPARGPPLWDLPDARTGACDPHAPPAPEYEFDQRLAW